MLLVLAQKDERKAVLVTLKCVDVFCELSMKTSGDPWSLERLEAMEQSIKKEFGRLTMNTAKKINWHLRPIGLLLSIHYVECVCAVEKLGSGKNESDLNQSMFCRWPLDRFNEDFNFTEWRKENKKETIQRTEVTELT